MEEHFHGKPEAGDWAYRCIEGYAGSQGHPYVCPSAGSPRITLLFSQSPHTLLISGSVLPDPTTGEMYGKRKILKSPDITTLSSY